MSTTKADSQSPSRMKRFVHWVSSAPERGLVDGLSIAGLKAPEVQIPAFLLALLTSAAYTFFEHGKIVKAFQILVTLMFAIAGNEAPTILTKNNAHYLTYVELFIVFYTVFPLNFKWAAYGWQINIDWFAQMCACRKSRSPVSSSRSKGDSQQTEALRPLLDRTKEAPEIKQAEEGQAPTTAKPTEWPEFKVLLDIASKTMKIVLALLALCSIASAIILALQIANSDDTKNDTRFDFESTYAGKLSTSIVGGVQGYMMNHASLMFNYFQLVCAYSSTTSDKAPTKRQGTSAVLSTIIGIAYLFMNIAGATSMLKKPGELYSFGSVLILIGTLLNTGLYFYSFIKLFNPEQPELSEDETEVEKALPKCTSYCDKALNALSYFRSAPGALILFTAPDASTLEVFHTGIENLYKFELIKRLPIITGLFVLATITWGGRSVLVAQAFTPIAGKLRGAYQLLAGNWFSITRKKGQRKHVFRSTICAPRGPRTGAS